MLANRVLLFLVTAARDGEKLNQDNPIPMEFDTMDMQTTDSNQGMLFG